MRRLWTAGLVLACMATAALAQSSAGGSSGGGSGTVSVSNFPATQPVSGTFWQATQPISGTVAATQSGTWNTGLTGSLPAFAATPTFNVGSTNGLALDATITARLGTLGQKAMAASAPVTIASDQVAVSVQSANRALMFADVTNASVATGGGTAAVSHDAGGPLSQWAKVNAFFFGSQALTYSIQGSNDNFASSAPLVASGTTTAGVASSITLPITFRYYRAFIVNNSGSTSSNVFVQMSFTAS